jgi:hypothetical protein
MDFTAHGATIVAALIAAVVSIATTLLTMFTAGIKAPLRYWLEGKALKRKLRIEYESEQRKKLHSLIAHYRGLLIESAESLNHRFWNLYKNDSQRWLSVGGDYSENNYYHWTWVLRFIHTLAIARAFEKQAIFIDERVAEKEDFEFLNLIKSWSWVTCDVELFEGLSYDNAYATDHLFRDDLRSICEDCWEHESFVSRDEFWNILKRGRLDKVCILFDGLHSKEIKRLRWDRLVCLHVLIMIFLNDFGYPNQKTSESQFVEVAKKIQNNPIAKNLKHSLAKLGLDDCPGGQMLQRILQT